MLEDLKANVLRAYMDTLSRMDLALCNAVSEFCVERFMLISKVRGAAALGSACRPCCNQLGMLT